MFPTASPAAVRWPWPGPMPRWNRAAAF